MKFKNIKKKVYVKKSPNNSRSIPAFTKVSAGKNERFKFGFPKFTSATALKLYQDVLAIFVVYIFIVAAFVVGYDFQKNLLMKKNIDSRREILTKELNFWVDFIAKHKNYKDAYFQASLLEYRLGDSYQAKKYVEEGLTLDPNFTDGKKLEQFLANK